VQRASARGIAAQYTALAQKVAEQRISSTDFVEELLVAEREVDPKI
jgi:hypothetical protein